MKQLLVSFHGGYLWLDKQIYLEPITIITSLPLAGIDLVLYLRKDQETMLENKMKDKYDLCTDRIGFLIPSINDHTVRFIVKVLDRK